MSDINAKEELPIPRKSEGGESGEASLSPEKQWPGVVTAYDFVKPSYDWLQSRLDAVNGRIQSLLTFATTLTIATPVFVKTLFPTANFASIWFIAAMIGFLVLTAIGIRGQMIGGMVLLSPEELYKQWLGWPEWEFKKNALFWSAMHFKTNASLVNQKGNHALAMNMILLLEVGCIFAWVLGSI